MSNETTERRAQSRPGSDDLDNWVGGEVTQFLGRTKSERRDKVDRRAGYRNGHGRQKTLPLSSGAMKLLRSSVRDSEKRFGRVTAPELELYDLWSDPGEFNNLAGSPEHRGVEKRLIARIM